MPGVDEDRVRSLADYTAKNEQFVLLHPLVLRIDEEKVLLYFRPPFSVPNDAFGQPQ